MPGDSLLMPVGVLQTSFLLSVSRHTAAGVKTLEPRRVNLSGRAMQRTRRSLKQVVIQ